MNKTKLFLMLSATILLMTGCASSNPVEKESTATPKVLSTVSTPSQASTSQAASTPTESSNQDWVTSFAEPILNAIAVRVPDYQDDFSDPASGWTVGSFSYAPDPEIAKQTGFAQSEYLAGHLGYQDGQYFNRANPLTDPAPDSSICVAGKNSQIGEYADFVAEFDTKFISGKHGNWSIAFHSWEDRPKTLYGKYGFGGNYLGALYFNKCGTAYSGCPALMQYMDDSLNLGTTWRHFQLIVRGAQMAVYLDGNPTFYFEDDHYSLDYDKGTFDLILCNFDDLPLESRWDNLRLWNISDLP